MKHSAALSTLLLIVTMTAVAAFAQDSEKKTIEPKHDSLIAIAKLQNRQNRAGLQLKEAEKPVAVLQDRILSLDAELNDKIKHAAKEKDVSLCTYTFDLENLVFIERTPEQHEKAEKAGLCPKPEEKKAEKK